MIRMLVLALAAGLGSAASPAANRSRKPVKRAMGPTETVPLGPIFRGSPDSITTIL